ncbi:MAG: Gfo/Idh/MocA family oxidoreductase [Pedosphaera sp.]|nr:Gfo/Idh/MocA family oxidoreductase [Pedosphaera sp.]
MNQLNRRSFVKKSALTTAALGLWPRLLRAQDPNAKPTGANGDIRVAVVGFHGRGGSHIGGFRDLKGVRIVALCDVDSAVLTGGVKQFADRGEKVEGFQDIRKLLERKDVDVISIATPNHWHALATIWAVQAGKDVYVEKPLSHNIFEGRQAVAAARKYGKMVQTGSQCRSSSGLIEAIAWLRAGNLGKIIRARGLCYKRRASIGKTDGPQPVPAPINYDLWCGPAPLDPPRRNSKKFGAIHYEWHWLWAFGNGDLGNQGVHQMDIARWVLGENALAPKTFSIGGRLGYEDDGETPNTMAVFHDYPTAPLIFEVRGLPSRSGTEAMDNYHGAGIGVVVDCEGGRMVIPSYSQAVMHDQDGKEIKKFDGGGDHFENFIKAVRSRKHTDLAADVQEGHLSAALCHTSNISYRLGKKLSPDALHDAIKNDKDAQETLGRMETHLAANQVDLKKTPATLGAVLKVDPKTEQFIGNDAANKLFTREYRKPFVVPEKV